MLMSQLQILLPMGGLGQRFRDEGYTTPKPLIEVEGIPMFLRAIGSFDALSVQKVISFIVRQDAEDEYGLATSIKNILPESSVIMLDHNTRGAAETALLAKDIINLDDPLIVMDCDFEFSSKEYYQYVQDILQNKSYDGILLGFNSDNPRYSYGKVDIDGFVTETAEKVVISNYALWGAYCFGRGGTFIKYAEKIIRQGLSEERREFYISYVYSEMIADGLKVKFATVDEFHSFGTPTELNEYLGRAND